MPNVLQVGATVNVAELKAGMEEAASNVRANTTQMSGAFQGLAAESRASVTEISSNWVKAAQASLVFKEAQSGVRSATRAAKEAEDEDTAALARLALAKREAAIAAATLKAAEEAATGANQKMGAATLGSSLLVRGLAQEMGVKIPRVVGSFIASMEGVGPLLRAAFPVIAAVGFIEVLAKIPEVIEKGISKLRGWDEEAKKDFERETEFAYRFRDAVESANQSVDKSRATEGKTGIARINAEMQVTQAAIEESRKRQKEYEKELGNLKGLKEATTPKFGQIFEGPGGVAQLGAALAMSKEREQAVKNIEEQEKEIQRLTLKQVELEKERKELQIKSPVEARKEGLEDEKARIEAEKKLSLEYLSTRETGIKQARAEEKISAQDELEDLNTLADLKLKVEEKYIAQLRQLLLKERATGKNITPELTGLDTESSVASDRNAAEKRANQARFDEESKRRAHEVAMAQIEASKSVSEAEVRDSEAAAKELYATHKITADQETSILEAAENRRADIQKAALQKQLAEFEKQPEKYAGQIIETNAKIEVAEKDHQAKLAAIRAEGSRKSIEDEVRRMEEQVAFIERIAQRELESSIRIDNERAKRGELTAKQAANLEIAAVQDYYAKVKVILEQEAELKKRLYGEESNEYKTATDKLVTLRRSAAERIEQIQTEEEGKLIQSVHRVSDALTHGLTEALQRHQTFAQSMAQVYNQMVANIIQSLGRWVAQEVLALATHKALAKQGIITDAKSAAVSAYKWVMAEVPFPANVILAPVAAAGVFAGALALGSFEHGGIIPGQAGQPRLVLAHGQEMFLGTTLSQRVQNMAGGGAGAGNRFNVHVAPTFHVNHPMTESDVRRHSKVITAEVQRELKQFNR